VIPVTRGKTFDQGERARELFDQGKSCNAIAKELDVAPSTISNWAKREGLSFERAQTAKAVTAHRIDRAAARADIIDRLYKRSQAILDRLEADVYVYYIAVPGEGMERVEDDNPPAIDEKNLASAIGIYVDKASRLELVDGDAGEESARSMLAELGTFLGVS
jgi:transposase-like protein